MLLFLKGFYYNFSKSCFTLLSFLLSPRVGLLYLSVDISLFSFKAFSTGTLGITKVDLPALGVTDYFLRILFWFSSNFVDFIGAGLAFSLLPSGVEVSLGLLSIWVLKNAGVLQSDFLWSIFYCNLFWFFSLIWANDLVLVFKCWFYIIYTCSGSLIVWFRFKELVSSTWI